MCTGLVIADEVKAQATREAKMFLHKGLWSCLRVQKISGKELGYVCTVALSMALHYSTFVVLYVYT